MLTARKNHGNASAILFFITIFTVTIPLCGGGENASVPLKSGLYWQGAAKIYVDKTRITGSINTSIGESGEAVCQFYFDGIISGTSFPIMCHNFIDTGSIPGTITIKNDSSLFIKTTENPGCSDKIADLSEDGKNLNLFKKLPFIQVRIVKSEKAFFYSTPDSSSKRKSYLIQGNEAEVSESKGGWLKVTFGKTTGWMLEKDMYGFHTDLTNK